MQKTPMTQHGYNLLEQELKHLKQKVRPQVIQDISEARSHGDLSENAEYDAAKEKQSFTEGRIKEIEYKISHSAVINPKEHQADGKIIFGVSVTIQDTDTEIETTYQIVGEDESDIKSFKLSVNSPLAKSLIGREEGDTVEVRTPNGVKEYEIIKIIF